MSLRTLSCLALVLFIVVMGCVTPTPSPQSTPEARAMDSSLALSPGVQDSLRQLPKTVIDYDRSLLDENDRLVVDKLIEASRYMDQIFWLQVSEKNPEWYASLKAAARTSSQHRAALTWFENMKGPWDRLHHEEPFVQVGKKPEGAGFYPVDMTKEELERWLTSHPEDKERFQGLFTVIRRDGDRLTAIPYSTYYRTQLVPASERIREAAALTDDASLRTYLEKLAVALLSDDYYESDLAWMDLRSDIEVVIGPYEVYEDALFNYKAAFESFVTVVDKPESAKLDVYARALPAMEQNLPIPNEHKNPNRGTESPIRVVQEIFTAGDARRGVQTAAFNLPNDERVREAKGSKKVLLKNVMEAKFKQSGYPVAERVLDRSQLPLVSFAPFFNHVLFHELAHGLGPGMITTPTGERVDTRLLLKNLYSTIEEAKADVVGTWSLLYAMDQKLLTAFDANALFATDVGLMFRSMRFGLSEAHGRGTAIQWNWYREKGAIVPAADGRFRVDNEKMTEAVRSLANELLMIEATGDFARAERLVNQYGKATPEIDRVTASLNDIPVDIAPVFVAAGEKM